MKYYFPESSIENPLTFFEFVYTDKGQTHLKCEFLSNDFDIEEYGTPEFDLEKEPLQNVYNDEETNEVIEVNYFFKDYLTGKFNSARSKSLNHFALRIDGCESKSGESFVLEKFQRVVDRCIDWVNNSNIPLKNGHLKYLKRLSVDLEQVFKYRTGLTPQSLQETEIDKLKKIIADLNFISVSDNVAFLQFLLCDDINSITSKIKVLCDNRQFQYIMDMFLTIGFPKKQSYDRYC